MTDKQVLMDMTEAEYLDEDGEITNEGRTWFCDVLDGRYELLEQQVPWFLHLLTLRRDGRFYDSQMMAFIFEFARVQAAFGFMLDELDEGDL